MHVCALQSSEVVGVIVLERCLVQLDDDEDQSLCSFVIGELLLAEYTHTRTHKHPFNKPLSGTTQVSRYQKGKTNLDFTEARNSEWQ